MKRLLLILLTLCALDVQAVERVTHYHNDALGSPIFATDQNGQLIWRRSYTPYGQEINRQTQNEPGYTGKFEEPGLGSSDFGARWYDPRIGRFLAIDPVGFSPDNPQSFNRYAYVNNNPYKYVDPDGRYLDLAIEAVSLSLGARSFSQNLSDGNYGAATVDAIGVGVDFLLAWVPLAPGAVGLGIQASRKTADAVADVTRGASNKLDEAFHYTSSSNADSIAETGLRAGPDGVFTTPNGTLSPLQAQIDLALRPNRDLPDSVFRIDLNEVRRLGIEVSDPRQAGRAFNMPGGETEVLIRGPVPPSALERIR